MFQSRLIAFLASSLALGLLAAPARSEMIHWSFTQVGDPGYIDAYTYFPSTLGGTGGRGVTGRMSFWGPPFSLPRPEVGSVVIPVDRMIIRGKGAFDSQRFAIGIVVEDSASQTSTFAQFYASLNGALDTSNRTSTVTVTTYGDLLHEGRQVLNLGQNTYLISLHAGPILWNPTDSDFEGTFYADVKASPTNAVGSLEPTSLVQVGMGLLTMLGLAILGLRVKG